MEAAALRPGNQPMTDKTDDTGKGPSRPGDPPKRPYATIDLQATEVGRERGRPASGAQPRMIEADAQPSGTWAWLLAMWTVLAGGLAAVGRSTIGLARSNTFLSHLSAGVAGAALVLAASGVGWLLAGGRGESLPADLGKRLAVVEKALLQRPALPGMRGRGSPRSRRASPRSMSMCRQRRPRLPATWRR
jgi:hypothetical protein